MSLFLCWHDNKFTAKKTRSPQGLYNWAASHGTKPESPPASLACISGIPQNFRWLNPRDKKHYYPTQYFNFSVTLLRCGLKILTDSWIEGESPVYPDDPPWRCHPGRQPTFIHFSTNTLKCLHGRQAVWTGSPTYPGHPSACPVVIFLGKLNRVS